MVFKPLYIDDHANIMKAILEHAYEISRLGNRPSLQETLKILIKSKKVDGGLKKTIETVVNYLGNMNKEAKPISQKEMDQLNQALSMLKKANSVQEMIGMLKAYNEMVDPEKYPRAYAIIYHTMNILIAGQDTIYNPDYYESFDFGRLRDDQKVKLRSSLKENLVEYARVDGRGALEAVRTLEMFVVFLIEPTTILAAVGTAAVCGAIQESGGRLVEAIWNRLRR